MTKLKKYLLIIKNLKDSLFKKTFFLLFFLLFFSCNRPTYPKEKLIQSIKDIAKKEYNLNIKVKLIGKSLWIYVAAGKLLDENFELNEKEVEKFSEASFVSSRVVFSSDADIIFIPLIIYDKTGIEIRLFRHITDIKKFRVMYISQKDYLTRSNLKISLNPEIFGRKIITSLIADIKENNRKKIKNYFDDFHRLKRKTYYLYKYLKTPLKTIKTIRTGIDESLIYIETKKNKKFLFHINSYFSDLIKNLLILYFSKLSTFKDNKKDKKNYPLRLSIIKNFWYLNKKTWPDEFKKYKNIKNWGNYVYGIDIKISDFISQQLKNRFQKKFEDNYEKWKIEFDFLEVSMLEKTIIIKREYYFHPTRKYLVDGDHELLLIIKKTIKDYNLDIEKVIIKDKYKIIKTISKKELLKLKKKKYKKIKLKKFHKNKISIPVIDIIRSILNPYF